MDNQTPSTANALVLRALEMLMTADAATQTKNCELMSELQEYASARDGLNAWDQAKLTAKALTEQEMTAAIYEMRARGAAVAVYDAAEIMTMYDGHDVDDNFETTVDEFMKENKAAIEDAGADAMRGFIIEALDGDLDDEDDDSWDEDVVNEDSAATPSF